MLISVEEYTEALTRDIVPVGTERLPLGAALGRVVAVPVVAKLAVPPFANSAMDGFALNVAADVAPGASFDVVTDIPAGSAPTSLPEGKAARIMTGAPVPEGATCVVPVEHTDSQPGPRPCPPQVTIHEPVTIGQHIRPAGEDIQPGVVGIEAGTVLTATALSTAASIGHAEVEVYRRPRVAIVSTGSELAEPGQALEPGQIPDSNSILLQGLLPGWGAEVIGIFRASDVAGNFAEVLAKAATEADVVVTTGGVSAGAYDPVKELAASGKAELQFAKVNQQPGKPQGYGRIGDAKLVALPGNPVSVFVSATIHLRAVLAKLQGTVSEHPEFFVPVAQRIEFKGGRRRYVPVRVDKAAGFVHEKGLGSHLVASLHLANALLVLPEEGITLEPGQLCPAIAI
ncbi:molybdopterin molybdotransferase MoeA [Corynebacterium sp. H130]|uniref:molybdopterin molybdotransferase MoeA n=1 Tax=Corynebacterium sp. H130 TaxID=3133444 RepID=UPI0030952220